MKKVISYILLTAMLVMQLSGCGMDEREAQNASNTEGIQGTSGLNRQEGAANTEGILDTVSVMNPGRQDNSLDVYSAAVHAPLGMEKPANAIDGGWRRLFLGTSRAWHFKKHLFEKVDECWDELSFVTAEGEAGSECFDRENQVWAVGPVAGTDHYVTFDYEIGENDKDNRYFLTERNEKNEALREYSLDFLSEDSSYEEAMSLSNFAVDRFGVVHLLRQTEEGQQYLQVSSNGEILTEYVPESGYIEELVPMYDGRVAFFAEKWGKANGNSLTTLQYMDGETGKPVLLAAPEKEFYCFALFDDNTLLYADGEGVYRSELSGNHPELLYRWLNHGIAVQGVLAMQADEEGRIDIIYKGSEKYHYLCLKPTTEKVEICEITLAVSPFHESDYQPFVVEFNKQYPACHIELKSDYDSTALLTELIAGKGPVLVDTWLTGFEEQEKLWEPLDTIIEKSGVMEELQPSTLEMGKINGTLYGIVTAFRLRTLVTGDPELKDWDYDGFLQCIEDRPGLEAIFNMYGGAVYGNYFMTSYLSHGLDDCYYLDAEAGTMNFESDGFRRALALAKKYCVREDAVNPGRSLLEGKVLCNELSIGKPEDMALYRICYGEDANVIGYPTKDGAAHFIEGDGSPLAIRRTATDEEKEAAGAFISLCLSYEGQSQAAKGINFGFSVRKDVLEEQFDAMNEHTELFGVGFGQITLGDDLNIELDRKTLLDMVDTARPFKSFPTELSNIVSEELGQYFSGAMTEDMLIDHLESRVGLYLGERNERD